MPRFILGMRTGILLWIPVSLVLVYMLGDSSGIIFSLIRLILGILLIASIWDSARRLWLHINYVNMEQEPTKEIPTVTNASQRDVQDQAPNFQTQTPQAPTPKSRSNMPDVQASFDPQPILERNQDLTTHEREAEVEISLEQEGDGELTYDDGSTWVGPIKNGQPHGSGIFTWNDGARYIGDYDYAVQATMQWTDGTTYVGDFGMIGVPDGQGTMTWADGTTYVGEFWNGKQHGYGRMYEEDGTASIGQWENGEFMEEETEIEF